MQQNIPVENEQHTMTVRHSDESEEEDDETQEPSRGRFTSERPGNNIVTNAASRAKKEIPETLG